MINYFPDYGCAPAMIKFDFVMIALSLPYCCSFFSVLGGRVSFLVSSRFFLRWGEWLVVQQLAVILLFL